VKLKKNNLMGLATADEVTVDATTTGAALWIRLALVAIAHSTRWKYFAFEMDIKQKNVE
jgi:hypothetical protein